VKLHSRTLKKGLKFKFNVVLSGISYDMRKPLGRLAKPDEIVLTNFVLTSDRSSYVHGMLIAVDETFSQHD